MESGTLGQLHEQTMPGKKALLIISNGKSAIENGYLSRTEAELQKAGVEWVIFNQVEANPLKSTVMAGANVARENECDFIVCSWGVEASWMLQKQLQQWLQIQVMFGII